MRAAGPTQLGVQVLDITLESNRTADRMVPHIASRLRLAVAALSFSIQVRTRMGPASGGTGDTTMKRAHEVLALMLILYPAGRFLLEIIRTDESGQFGTALTISQWVSIGMIVVGFGLLIYVRSKTPTLADAKFV